MPFQGFYLISPDDYERFLRNTEERIDSADREMKQRTENNLKAIADNYRRLHSDRLVHELGLVDEARATGDAAAVNHHRVLAEIYRPMLDSWHTARAT